MIGAIRARRQARALYGRLNAHDLDGFMRGLADDVVFDFPGPIGSTHHVGKAAVRAFFKDMLDDYPGIRFTVRHVAVENIFSVTGTTAVLVEWDLDVTSRAGRTSHDSGVTSMSARRGRIVRLRDYISDSDSQAAANVPEPGASGSTPAGTSESSDQLPGATPA